MDPAAQISLLPLIEAFRQGSWGSNEVVGYLALEILAKEFGIPFRRVRMIIPHYPSRGVSMREAIAAAMVISKNDCPVLCDLSGNQTPAGVAMAFAKKHGLDVNWPRNWKSLSAWEDAPPRKYRPGSPSQARLDHLVAEGRSILLASHLHQATPSMSNARLSRRI